jgi:hypothetical protein
LSCYIVFIHYERCVFVELVLFVFHLLVAIKSADADQNVVFFASLSLGL